MVFTDLADLSVLQMITTSGLSTSGKLLTNHLLLLQALKGNTGWVWSGYIERLPLKMLLFIFPLARNMI